MTPNKKIFIDKTASGEFVSLSRSMTSPLSKAEEKVHTSLTKRKLNFSTDKKSLVCKTGGQVRTDLMYIYITNMLLWVHMATYCTV